MEGYCMECERLVERPSGLESLLTAKQEGAKSVSRLTRTVSIVIGVSEWDEAKLRAKGFGLGAGAYVGMMLRTAWAAGMEPRLLPPLGGEK